MNWIQRLFGWKKKKPQESYMQSEELLKLRELDSFMRALLQGDHYVARSEYLERINDAAELYNWFRVLRSSGTMEE